MALMNLVAAFAITSWPERQTDLDTIQRWGRAWLLEGVNIYAVEGESADYPPHAIVMLSPLGTLTAKWAVVWWASINVLLLPLAPWLAIKHVNERATISGAAIPMLMFLCWSGSRTLLQFSLVALVFGLAAIVLADRRPAWSGVCLGLSLMKPQMAAPFFVWVVFTRRWKVARISLLLMFAGFGLYCARAGANPTEVASRYFVALGHYHSGDAMLIGLAQLRPLIARAAQTPAVVDMIAAASALVLFAVICAMAFVERRQDPRVMFAAPPLVALWSLLTFYHLTYGFLVLLPLAALLVFGGQPETVVYRMRLFWVLQLGLMFDVPGIWLRFGPYVSAPAWTEHLIMHFDRGLMLGLFVATALLAVKAARLQAQRVP